MVPTGKFVSVLDNIFKNFQSGFHVKTDWWDGSNHGFDALCWSGAATTSYDNVVLALHEIDCTNVYSQADNVSQNTSGHFILMTIWKDFYEAISGNICILFLFYGILMSQYLSLLQRSLQLKRNMEEYNSYIHIIFLFFFSTNSGFRQNTS